MPLTFVQDTPDRLHELAVYDAEGFPIKAEEVNRALLGRDVDIFFTLRFQHGGDGFPVILGVLDSIQVLQ